MPIPSIKSILYVVLGLSLGSGITLIALQERFVRERRRLLAMGESQRSKAAQAAVAVLTKQWEQKAQQQEEEFEACKERLAAFEAIPQRDPNDIVDRSEHERLIQEKNHEIARLTDEIKSLNGELASHQEELKDLQGQIAYLNGEIIRLNEEKKSLPDDDFLLLGNRGGHLLPGSIVRAFIKGR